jgi:Trk K+ transport system NAD-binding subunit
MSIIVVGCGKAGYNHAKELSPENHNVAAIDSGSVSGGI